MIDPSNLSVKPDQVQREILATSYPYATGVGS